METIDQEVWECVHCKNLVEITDKFCPHCGSLFEEGSYCGKHRALTAAGVCVICHSALCRECGSWEGGVFVCAQHAGLEIHH